MGDRKSENVKDQSLDNVRKLVASRQTSRVMVARRQGSQKRSPKLVSLMLSSPVTLLTMSIRKEQFTQTKQIIKVPSNCINDTCIKFFK